ncbi:hypothetical protein K7X08_007146 [Anisodus acutangulus]|uniref:Uncharacterized protein n=1 Tax=Anisodus acutangulus TaxID=402998 RepID=A0A9Q1QY03_9SOLA|nr:hypothetical protein K7X08_007146 [Anisodus acutangulus]
MEVYENQKGLNVKQKMLVPNSCWQRAYQSLSTVCSKALADEELKSRLSWNLCDCFHTGRMDAWKHEWERLMNSLKDSGEFAEEKIVNILQVGEDILKSKADDIGNIAGQALDKQKQFLDAQSEALHDLQVLLNEFEETRYYIRVDSAISYTFTRETETIGSIWARATTGASYKAKSTTPAST